MAYALEAVMGHVLEKSTGTAAAGFPDVSASKTCSFKDSLLDALKNRCREESSEKNNLHRKEIVFKSGSKLRDTRRSELKENDTEFRESEEKYPVSEEIIEKLNQLILLLQSGNVGFTERKAFLESIESALNGLEGNELFISNSARDFLGKMQEVIEELKVLPEGSGKNESLDSSKWFDFTEQLKELALGLRAEYVSNKSENISGLPEESSLHGDSSNLLISEDLEKARIAVTEKEISDGMHGSGNLSKADDESTVEGRKGLKEEQTPVVQRTEAEYEVEEMQSEEEDTEINALKGKIGKLNVQAESDKQNQKPRDTGESRNAHQPDGKPIIARQEKVLTDELNAVQQNSMPERFDNTAVQETADLPGAQTVDRSEIINQIVKKAEVILADSNPEMRMQLEPENLGRLSLKIVVERGLVTAKFTVENQEVKQILESSFNELRDMLQEKGMGVQNLSVTVGQQSRDYNSGNEFSKWHEAFRLNGRRIGKSDGYGVYPENEGIPSDAVNPYILHDGKFDYRI